MRINYSFWVLVIYSLFTGYFNELMILLFCLLIHEIGHLLIAFTFHIPIKGFHLSIVGCEIVYLDNNISKYSQFLFYIFGIVFNFICAIICYLTNYKLVFNFSVLLIVVNLLPIYPLDGFNVLSLFLSKTALVNISFVILVIMFFLAINYNSLGLLYIFICLLIKLVKYLKMSDKQKLYNIIKNIV